VKKILIYIPTFNRRELLKQNLSLINDQLIGNSSIRVFVSDNSQDSVEETEIRTWVPDIKQFSYRKNAGNIGGNANIAGAFLEARADEILWILADDTLIALGAIQNLINLVSIEADVYSLSRGLPSRDFQTRTFQYNRRGIASILKEESWGLISSCLYNMAFISRHIENAYTYFNASAPHLAILFAAMQETNSVTVVDLDEGKIHQGNLLGGDYSASLVGGPQLFHLAPKWERKNLAKSWVRRQSGALYANEGKHQLSASATKAVLIKEAGVYARFFLVVGFAEVVLRRSSLGKKVEYKFRNNAFVLKLYAKTGRIKYSVKNLDV
jgi:glycosyltransferase involved in cell wall biosynthesis